MSNVLEEIVAGVREDLAERMTRLPLDKIAAQAVEAPPSRDALRALSGPRLSVISEVKRSSPSKGALADIPAPADLARANRVLSKRFAYAPYPGVAAPRCTGRRCAHALARHCRSNPSGGR